MCTCAKNIRHNILYNQKALPLKIKSNNSVMEHQDYLFVFDNIVFRKNDSRFVTYFFYNSF